MHKNDANVLMQFWDVLDIVTASGPQTVLFLQVATNKKLLAIAISPLEKRYFEEFRNGVSSFDTPKIHHASILLLGVHNITVEKVLISKLQDDKNDPKSTGVLLAEMHTKSNSGETVIAHNMRPSDTVLLSLYAECSVYMPTSVLERLPLYESGEIAQGDASVGDMTQYKKPSDEKLH